MNPILRHQNGCRNLHYIMDVPNIGYNHLEMTNLHYKIAGTHPLYLSIKALRYKILISTKRYASTSFFGNILKPQRSGLETPHFIQEIGDTILRIVYFFGGESFQGYTSTTQGALGA